MPEPTHQLVELTKEEAEALTKDLQDVLKKHNCEMGVRSAIELMKRVPVEIPSPFMPKVDGKDNDKTEESPDSTPA